jgi:hypothetical protein
LAKAAGRSPGPTDEADELRRAGRFGEAVQVSLRAVSLQVDLEPTLARAMERGDFHRGAREAELQAALAAFAGPSVSR